MTSKTAIYIVLLNVVFIARLALPEDGVAQSGGNIAAGVPSRSTATEGRGKEHLDQMEEMLKEQRRANPNDYLANHNLGEFYAQHGKLRQALPYMARAQTLAPHHYDNGYDLALLYLKVSQFVNARAVLEQMLESNDVAELHNLLGEVENGSGNYKLAAAEYQRSAQMQPTEQNIFDWANFLVQHQDLNEAPQDSVAVFRYGIEKYPHSAQLRVGLGVALFNVRQFDEAVEALCAGVDLNPADPRALVFLGRVSDASPKLAGEVLERLANFVRLYPKNASANYYYALALWQSQNSQPSRGNIDDVEALLKKAVALDPLLYEPYFQLGVLYQEQKRYSEAIAEYKKTVRLRPDFGQAHYRLAEMYKMSGEKELAHKEFSITQQLHAREGATGTPVEAGATEQH